MNFEGNLAANLPVQPDKQEEVKKSDAERLVELRKIQLSEGREFTEEERAEFLSLQQKEDEVKTGLKVITEMERNRFAELTKKQANGEIIGDSEKEELVFLYDRMEGQR